MAADGRESTAKSVSSRLHDVVSQMNIQRPEARSGLKESWDTLVKVMFAPCAGDIGGVPREEALGSEQPSSFAGSGGDRGGGELGVAGNTGGNSAAAPSWGASVPFEVSASQSSFQGGASFISQNQEGNQQQQPLSSYPTQQLNNNPQQQHHSVPVQEQRRSSPQDQRKAASRAKLRQLGARHQLSSGFHGKSLAESARPISARAQQAELAQAAAAADTSSSSPDLVDFDDGISAISSHTLEELERRRVAKGRKHVVRLHPLDFSQIIDENAELHTELRQQHGPSRVEGEEERNNTEVVFGQPFYNDLQQEAVDAKLLQNVRTVVNESNGIAHEEFTPSPGRVTPTAPPSALARVTSTRSSKSSRTQQTHNTTITEDSHEFEEMYNRHEQMYWIDSDQVANAERVGKGKNDRNRPSQRTMIIEERARRLRELSRSRSRSDGTGSVSKSLFWLGPLLLECSWS